MSFVEKEIIPDEDTMIKELRQAGIRVESVLMAFVPIMSADKNNPHPIADEPLFLMDAYRRVCLSPMRHYDPFSGFHNRGGEDY